MNCIRMHRHHMECYSFPFILIKFCLSIIWEHILITIFEYLKILSVSFLSVHTEVIPCKLNLYKIILLNQLLVKKPQDPYVLWYLKTTWYKLHFGKVLKKLLVWIQTPIFLQSSFYFSRLLLFFMLVNSYSMFMKYNEFDLIITHTCDACSSTLKKICLKPKESMVHDFF